MGKKSGLITDPAHDVLRWERQPLDCIFRPKTVAVIGATEREGSVGRAVMVNLNSFGGKVFPVNPGRPSVLGCKTYPNVKEIPESVDLAVVVTPATTLPEVIGDCVSAGVGGAIVLSAGFREVGSEGKRLEDRILEQMRGHDLRLIGPNCLGIMNPAIGLNATFAQDMALTGNVAFLSQSGALCTAILDWSLEENVGFSAFVSMGSMLDVGWGDLIYYFGDDPQTRSILIYMESVGDARSFLSAAREVARTKPIIVIKPGRTDAASKAAVSHTGALTGSDEVLNAAFRRCGVLRVNRIAELFEMADVLGKQPRPRGRRLTIVTNAGGPGVLATDALIQSGGELTKLSNTTLNALDNLLPPHWSHGNPIDILGDADPDRFAKVVELAVKDAGCDGLLVILAPQGMTKPADCAQQLVPHAQKHGIPVLAAWMGGASTREGAAVLTHAGIPTFSYPDEAARAFSYLWRYSDNLRALYETPFLAGGDQTDSDRQRAFDLLRAVRDAGRALLTEWESKRILVAYGIPAVQTEVARDAEEAVRVAERIGYPVVVKLHSDTITHKSDIGGVRLNLHTADAVREAYRLVREAVEQRVGPGQIQGVTVQPMVKPEGYELILGSSPDPQFGPVLLFGAGGELVEVFRDRALALPPLTTTLARRMMEQTRIYKALQGVRGRKPADLNTLESLLVRFSQLVAEQRWIKEIDINPLLVSADRIIALDARIVLYPPAAEESSLPRLAIRPYPVQYISTFQMKNGSLVRIRAIRPEDEPAMVRFHKKLSDNTVYMRYLGFLRLEQRIAHERLTRICFIDYDREMALVAELVNPATSQNEIIGVGRLSKSHGRNDAEVAILVRDEFQGLGLGSELLRRILGVARDEKLDRVLAVMLAENVAMQKIAARAGFRLGTPSEDQLVAAVAEVSAMQAAASLRGNPATG